MKIKHNPRDRSLFNALNKVFGEKIDNTEREELASEWIQRTLERGRRIIREQKEECEYCSGDTSLIHKIGDYDLMIEDGYLSLLVRGHDGDFWEENREGLEKINYCPKCGKKLKGGNDE